MNEQRGNRNSGEIIAVITLKGGENRVKKNIRKKK